MMVTQEYLHLPIIPMVGAGGIEIDDSEVAVLAKIGEPSIIRPGRLRKDESGELEFYYYTGLVVHLIDRKVVEVDAAQGYLGSTPHGLRVGTTWAELCRTFPAITFSEELMVWYIPGIDGLSLEIVRPARAEELSDWGAERLLRPWIDEVFEVMEPDYAFVNSIAVHRLHYDG